MSRKGDIPISESLKLILGIAVVLTLLSVVVPLILSQEGNVGCVGPMKWVLSPIADSTGVTLC